MPFDPRKHIIRPPAAGAPQPPRPYLPQKPAKVVLPGNSSRRLAAVPGKIDVVPFTEFPDIVVLNFSQYEGIMPLLKRHICARSELEDAVNNIILNLLVNSPQKVVKPGKLDYNHFEKQYNHDQLMGYLNTITCIDVVFSKSPSKIGNFTRKETYLIEKIQDAERPLKGKYHLAYIDDNYRDSFAKAVEHKKEQIREALLEPYVSQMETIECEIERKVKEMGEAGLKEYEFVENTLHNILRVEAQGIDDARGEQQILEAIKYMQSKQPPGPFDGKIIDLLNIAHHCYRIQRSQSPEVEAEMRKIPSYEQILESVASCLEPKGVLILNPAQERTFQGLKYLGNFGKVGMYQKV
jgi:hypothetical protein